MVQARALVATAIAAVLVLGSGAAMLRASAPRIPAEMHVTHEVDGNAHVWLHVEGLEELQPLPKGFRIQIVLPSGFRLDWPAQTRARVDGDVAVHQEQP
jgi:hypothetical protein